MKGLNLSFRKRKKIKLILFKFWICRYFKPTDELHLLVTLILLIFKIFIVILLSFTDLTYTVIAAVT